MIETNLPDKKVSTPTGPDVGNVLTKRNAHNIQFTSRADAKDNQGIDRHKPSRNLTTAVTEL